MFSDSCISTVGQRTRLPGAEAGQVIFISTKCLSIGPGVCVCEGKCMYTYGQWVDQVRVAEQLVCLHTKMKVLFKKKTT